MKPSNNERRSDSSASVSLSPFRSFSSPRLRVPTVFVGETRTKQSFEAECNVNNIMRRYMATGIMPGQDRVAGARYMDCTGADFQNAMMVVASAKTAFNELNSALRERFGNDPQRMLEFVEDNRNLEEARKLGLARAEAKEATPLAVRVVEPAHGDPSKALTRVESGSTAATIPASAPK